MGERRKHGMLGRRSRRGATMLNRPTRLGVYWPSVAGRWSARRGADRDGGRRAAVVGEKAARAVDSRRDSRCDRLMYGKRTSTAVVGGSRLVLFSMLSLSFVTFTIAFPPRHILLLDGAMSLLIHLTFPIAVAVEAAASVDRLGIHRRGSWGGSGRKQGLISISHRMISHEMRRRSMVRPRPASAEGGADSMRCGLPTAQGLPASGARQNPPGAEGGEIKSGLTAATEVVRSIFGHPREAPVSAIAVGGC